MSLRTLVELFPRMLLFELERYGYFDGVELSLSVMAGITMEIPMIEWKVNDTCIRIMISQSVYCYVHTPDNMQSVTADR